MTLGEALKARRQELGLSGWKATYRLEVARMTYDGWEKNHHVPDPKHWEKIAEFLGVSKVDVAILLGAIDQAEVIQFCSAQPKSTRARFADRKPQARNARRASGNRPLTKTGVDQAKRTREKIPA